MVSDAVQRAEEAVQTSRESLKTAVEGHKIVSQSLSELMDQAVDLGLKSKARTHTSIRFKGGLASWCYMCRVGLCCRLQRLRRQ